MILLTLIVTISKGLPKQPRMVARNSDVSTRYGDDGDRQAVSGAGSGDLGGSLAPRRASSLSLAKQRSVGSVLCVL